MNYLEKLLQGAEVEWKTLGEVASFRRGSFPQPYGHSEWYDGEEAMPFVQVADISDNMLLTPYTKRRISAKAQPMSVFVPKGTVIVSLQGTIGRVAITQYDAYVDRTIAIFQKLDSLVEKKYFAYQLKIIFETKEKLARGSTLKTITKDEFTNFEIPIPPLSVQQEIVRILDTLTAMTAELTAELNLRQKQYQHYRDKLLTFGDEVEWKTLGEVTSSIQNIKWQDNVQSYRYIDLTSVDRENHCILETTEITALNAPSRAQKLVKKDDVIFATTRPTQQRFTIINEEYDGQIASTGYCVLRAKKEANILPKWIYYQISTVSFKNYTEEHQSGSAYPAISDTKVKEFKIPAPSPETQAKIIAILDKFEILTNSITEGLPREIELRTKQYEYYREMLLGFEK